jgi:hypothetical protein
VHFSPGFPSGAGFPEEEFAPENCGGAPIQGEFSAEAAPAGSQSGEECSGILLAPRRSNLLGEKPFFPHVVSSDEIAPREILLLEESWAKAHWDWHHFKKSSL